MYSYITSELPTSLYAQFANLDSSRVSIMGHSMGGHGALTIFLKNPGTFKSVSAFAPIANPKNCAWGQKAFGGYLENQTEWDDYDATELVKKWAGDFEALIDVGDGDNFYKQGQLLPENFAQAANAMGKGEKLKIRMQPGYDHSYFFISTFAEDHINYHAAHLL
jgi:S-formylglutathione hydrolase